MSNPIQTLNLDGSSSTTPIKVEIDMKEFTDNVELHTDNFTVSGDGIFDVMMNTATKHLIAQLLGSRIREENYADMYVQLYQATLQAAVQIWLQKGIAEKQLELLQAQLDLYKEQQKAEKAKTGLYMRQIEALDEDFLQKILKINVEAWGVGFSVAKDSFQASGIPAVLQKTTIDDLYNQYIVPNLDKFNYGREYVQKMLEMMNKDDDDDPNNTSL